MSRSRKHSPVSGTTTCRSEKDDKRQANRRLRAAVRSAFASGAEAMPELREVSDVWTFEKYGKSWLSDQFAEWMRK